MTVFFRGSGYKQATQVSQLSVLSGKGDPGSSAIPLPDILSLIFMARVQAWVWGLAEASGLDSGCAPATLSLGSEQVARGSALPVDWGC